MPSLTSLRNIGDRSAQWLESVGIHTAEELFEVGVVAAYKRAKAAYPDRVTLNLLYALQGAYLGLHWTELPSDMKAALRREAGESG